MLRSPESRPLCALPSVPWPNLWNFIGTFKTKYRNYEVLSFTWDAVSAVAAPTPSDWLWTRRQRPDCNQRHGILVYTTRHALRSTKPFQPTPKRLKLFTHLYQVSTMFMVLKFRYTSCKPKKFTMSSISLPWYTVQQNIQVLMTAVQLVLRYT